jgi:hypothetical protein
MMRNDGELTKIVINAFQSTKVKYLRNTVKYLRNTVKYLRNTVKYLRNTVKYLRKIVINAFQGTKNEISSEPNGLNLFSYWDLRTAL